MSAPRLALRLLLPSIIVLSLVLPPFVEAAPPAPPLLTTVSAEGQPPPPVLPEGWTIQSGVAVAGQPAPAEPASVSLDPPPGWYINEGVLSQTPPEPSTPAALPDAAGVENGVSTGAPPDEAWSLPDAESAVGYCIPWGTIRINFDDAAQPKGFSETKALRTQYRLQGVLFSGPASLDGGAVLDQGSNFGVSGFSAPNFLAFNRTSNLSGGGTPRPPETLFFPGGATRVSMGVASYSSAGTSITIRAYDFRGRLVGSASRTLAAAMARLQIHVDEISRVVIDTQAEAFVVDDLVYTPLNYLERLSFDETSRPDLFVSTTALRTDYQSLGITFSGPGGPDGGAVVKGWSWAVTGYSAPNILGFNREARMSDGGAPRPPETIVFATPLEMLTVFAASVAGRGAGNTITLQAYSPEGQLIRTVSDTLESTIRPLSVQAIGASRGIARIVIDSPATDLVLDDFLFVRHGASYVDFDSSLAPTTFSETTAARNAYRNCDVTFAGPSALDGGAVLDEDAHFNVNGYSAPNFLAFNTTSTLNNGGMPRPPEDIYLQLPASYALIYAASSTDASTPITLYAYDSRGTLLGSKSRTLTANLEPLWVLANGISHLRISSSASVFVLDNLTLIYKLKTWLPLVVRQ